MLWKMKNSNRFHSHTSYSHTWDRWLKLLVKTQRTRRNLKCAEHHWPSLISGEWAWCEEPPIWSTSSMKTKPRSSDIPTAWCGFSLCLCGSCCSPSLCVVSLTTAAAAAAECSCQTQWRLHSGPGCNSAAGCWMERACGWSALLS